MVLEMTMYIGCLGLLVAWICPWLVGWGWSLIGWLGLVWVSLVVYLILGILLLLT